MHLRHFLYRDDPLIEEFIAQVEGGIYDQAEQKTHEGGNSGVGAGLSAGAATGRASRSRERSQEETRTVRQTGASQFERLHLSLGDHVQFLEAIDDQIWDQLRKSEVLEVEAVCYVVGLGKLADAIAAFDSLAPLIESVGGDAMDRETTEAVAGFRGLAAAASDKPTIIARLAGTPRYSVACRLKADSLLVPIDELEGEATVVGKVQRKLRDSETYLLPGVLGGLESMIPEEDQGQFASFFDDDIAKQLGLTSPLLKHPAALITPIAIFR